MRIVIAGIDGYLGWPLAQHLASQGHEIAGIDRFLRRAWVDEMGGESAIPVAGWSDRAGYFRERMGRELVFADGDLCEYAVVHDLLASFRPDAIVHLGEMPSAPYSMMDVQHAVFTQRNNVVGTLNLLFAMRDVAHEAHLVKLGTMGEYGTPNVDIPEGFFEIEYRGRKDRLPFPRQANSMYHLSKVHDSANVTFACRVWGLRSTDIMQGVVYGTRVAAMDPSDPRARTRLDFDQCFGTALNRYCTQAVIGEPLSVYGTGGQKRGFLPLRDSIQCLTLALENPPERGEYRVFNQFEDVYDVATLARKVQAVGRTLGLDPQIVHLENPRAEIEHHHYKPDHEHLLNLGYRPTRDMETELADVLSDLIPHRERIARHRAVLAPDIRWSGERRRMGTLPVEEASNTPAARPRAQRAASGASRA
ncbi:MAG: NAD-dependent epimerase/dehydratase family protein [Deltaproteobacteria bacterium]|nr:NAD-dependent epimerase/dehydratase family protein [Deltaproteobacteria bacterium]